MLLVSKYEGRCKTCHVPIRIGAQVGYRPGEKGVWCLQCVPTDVRSPKPLDTGAMPKVSGPGTMSTPPPLHKPQLLGHTALLKAMSQFEDAVIERFSSPKMKVTPELEKSWDRYSKLKAHALQPGSDQEGQTALRLAFIEVIKLAL